MSRKDPRVDAYIAAAAPFARPILKHIRKLVHAASPTAQETIKWSFPHFEHHGIICGIAAFKAHCALGFWKASLLFDRDQAAERTAMGNFGRIISRDQLPPDEVMIDYIRRAADLNERGVQPPGRTSKPNPSRALAVPDDFGAALAKNRRAKAAFDAFSYSGRKEYVQWIADAKRDATRLRRIATALEWLAEGKPHNWRYARKPAAA